MDVKCVVLSQPDGDGCESSFCLTDGMYSIVENDFIPGKITHT